MRIMATAAPHLGPGYLATLTAGQLLGMVRRCARAISGARPYKHRKMTRKEVPRSIRESRSSCPRHASRSREMALKANTVPSGGIELHRVHNCPIARTGLHRCNVPPSGSMATFAANARFQKRRVGISILSTFDQARSGSMTLQTRFLDWPRQVDSSLTGKTRREIPTPRRGKIRDGSLKQKALDVSDVAAADCAGTNRPFQVESAADAASRPGEVHPIVRPDSVTCSILRVANVVEALAETAASNTCARAGHACSAIGLGNGRMAACADSASHQVSLWSGKGKGSEDKKGDAHQRPIIIRDG